MIGRGIAWGGVAVAAVAVAVLHVVGTGRLDPLAHTVSDYVVLPGGAALLGLAGAGLIAAGFAAAAPHGSTVRRVMLLWGAAVLLVALFPTNLPDQPPDVSAVVHRWAGALVFALPPSAGLLASRTADGPSRRRLRTGAVVAALAAGAFLLAHAPHVLAGADPFGGLGLVERVAYVALLALLPLLATSGPRPVVPAPVPAMAGSAT